VTALPGRLQIFDIMENGELMEITPKGDLKAELRTDRVLIIVDDEEKKIWLWKGGTASVRKKFIAARQAQNVRGQRGLVYRVIPIDEGEERDDLLAALGLKAPMPKPKPQVAVEVQLPDRTIAIDATTLPSDTPASTPRPSKPGPSRPARPPSPPSSTSTPAPSPSPVSPQNTGEEYEGFEREWRREAPPPGPTPTLTPEEIIGRVQAIRPPPGYRRELVIIGHEVFTTVNRTISFLGKTTTTTQLERTRKLPEGTFFGGDYTPRILVEGGRVLATEFLKKVEEPHDQPILRDTTRDADVGELIDIFRITATAAERSSKRKKR